MHGETLRRRDPTHALIGEGRPVVLRIPNKDRREDDRGK